MALSDLAKNPADQKPGPECSVCLALAALPDDQASLLQGALENPQWRYTEIETAVSQDLGVPAWVRKINHQTYKRHVMGRCDARTPLRPRQSDESR